MNSLKSEVEVNPIPEDKKDYASIEKEIIRVFKEELYGPLMREIGYPARALKNSMEDLLNAISSNQVSYSNGRFTGRFNASISRQIQLLGGKWRKGAWYLNQSKLPVDVRIAIGVGDSRFSDRLHKVNKTLSELSPEKIAQKVKLKDFFERAIGRVDRSVQKSLKKVVVAPEITQDRKKRIAEEYTNNLRLYIKSWSEKEIVELRKTVQKRVFRGGRNEDLARLIQTRYGVSQRKSAFLARQETSLLMTSFKQMRYTDAGSRKYKWKCVTGSAAHPVRKTHKALDGKIFSWDSPPITDKLGHRNHPGRDFNCRCVAIPIIEFKKNK